MKLSIDEIIEPNIYKYNYEIVDIIDYTENMCFSEKQYTISIANVRDKFYLVMNGCSISDVYELIVSDDGIIIDENKKIFADLSKFKFAVTCQIDENTMYHIGTINSKFPVVYARKFVDDYSMISAMAYLKALMMSMGYLPGSFVLTNNVDDFKNILYYKHRGQYQSYVPTATKCYSHLDIMSILRLAPDVDYHPDYIGRNDSIHRLKDNLNSIGYVMQGLGILNIFCNMLIRKENIEIFSQDIIDIYNELYRALAKFVPRDKYLYMLKSVHMYMPHYFNRDMCNIVTRHGIGVIYKKEIIE